MDTSQKSVSKSRIPDGYEEAVLMEQEKENCRIQLQNIKDESLKRKSFHQTIKQSRQSLLETRKTSSFQTVLGIVNTMVGSVALVLPPNVTSGGLIMSVIVMTIIGYISYKTCAFIVIYKYQQENDLSEVINRILGKKWARAFSISSCLLLFLAGIIYFLLMNSVLYPILKYIMIKSHYTNFAPTNEISFNQMSIQYQSMILIIPCFMIFCCKNLSAIMKLSKIGAFAIFSYGVFITYIFIDNLVSGNVKRQWHTLPLFTSDLAGVAGSFALAYFVHNIICQIMTNNKEQTNNLRDLKSGYSVVYIIYAFIGVFGCIGVLGRGNPDIPKNTISSYFEDDDIRPRFVEFLFLIQLFSVTPILNFVSRTQFFSIFQDEYEQISNRNFHIYNIVFSACCVGFQISNISPSIVIGLNGAVCGFLIVYIVPLAMRIKKSKQGGGPNSEIYNEESLLVETEAKSEPQYTKQQYIHKIGVIEKVLWFIALSIGTAIVVFQLINIVKSIKN